MPTATAFVFVASAVHPPAPTPSPVQHHFWCKMAFSHKTQELALRCRRDGEK